MAWAIFEPATLGMFFPGGELVGYDEQLQTYYDTEMSGAEKEAMGMQDRILHSEFVWKHSRDSGPLNDLECPKVLRLRKTPKQLGAMFFPTPLIVTETLKNIIESVEPDLHQFWPMTIELPRGKIWPEQCYGMRIATFLDSFRPKQRRIV